MLAVTFVLIAVVTPTGGFQACVLVKSRKTCCTCAAAAAKQPAFEAWYDEYEEQQLNKQLAQPDSIADATGRPNAKAGRQATNAKRSSSAGSSIGVRINKCFRNTASRREADCFLAEGLVKVNGKPATAGDRVLPGDKVTLNGKLVRWTAIPGLLAEATAAASHGNTKVADSHKSTQSSTAAAAAAGAGFVYLKYWKPAGVTCTTDSADSSNILVQSGVAKAFRGQRLFPVGRLDKDSTGCILLTSDGRVPGAVLQPEAHKSKVYTVTVKRPISDATLQKFAEGVVITAPVQRDSSTSGRAGSAKMVTAKTLPCEARRVAGRLDTFAVVLREGRNRQIRRMCEELGHSVLALHRESFMGITLAGMREGEWKELSKKDMKTVTAALRESQQPTGVYLHEQQ